MEIPEALAIIEANKTKAGELIYDEAGAQVLLNVSERALSVITSEDEEFGDITRTKEKMVRLLEAFKTIALYNQNMCTTFPLLFTMNTLMHPEGGVIISSVEQGLTRIEEAGNWPTGMAPLEEVLASCTKDLAHTCDLLAKRDPGAVNLIPSHFFIAIIGNRESHPLIRLANAQKQITDPEKYVALGVPNSFGPVANGAV